MSAEGVDGVVMELREVGGMMRDAVCQREVGIFGMRTRLGIWMEGLQSREVGR